MRIFQFCYDQSLKWAAHRHAPYYLGSMSFAESVFFPIPPDVMLMPMTLAKPQKAWFYALLTTLTSVLGGILGFVLGWFAYDSLLQPLIIEWGYQDKLDQAVNWFESYGIWVVFLAGFSPIPYKVFTISAGMLQMAFLPFLLASAIGRGMRFYLVAALMRWGGAAMATKLRDYVDAIGWSTVILASLAYLLLR
ncbi:Undecaprenyl-diphosphate phosphatase [Saliniradius amylolyticus]|uniref:Undecaprenyl-diphosphate phosphatase n=1 Tax=Saliniradius amylolyticus TaxID=2183582 RepID=A0A2S2E052_9ALTE|nr:YqaA family protein [Saliniradius amylolyticus]AWL11024.1 Undecaprenyl-diphosphate phosphatase [Saliniradius amylolyticus]